MDIIKDNKYLVTVNIEDLINPNIENSIFLGEWCIPYDKRYIYKNIEVLDFIWKDRKKYEEAYSYCIEVFEEMLIKLREEINLKFNISFDLKYYRIILSPWLIHYIHQSYDKYVSIREAYEKHSNYIFYTLDKKYNYIPTDYEDFLLKIINNEVYNLQQYTQIIRYLDMPNENIETKFVNKQVFTYVKQSNLIKKNVDKLISMISSLFYREELLTTIVNPYFLYNRLVKYKLSFYSRFKYVLNDFDFNINLSLKIFKKERGAFPLAVKNKTFKNYLLTNIMNDIPLIYFENLLTFSKYIGRYNIRKTKLFYTANAHYGNEVYKFFVAKYHKDITTIITQHGGVNGTHLLSLEEVDCKLADFIFTFGYVDRKNEIPMYSFNMSLLKNNFKYIPVKKQILLISTGQPKRLFRFHSSYTATEYEILINQTIDFYRNLNTNLNVVYRKYQDHYGWFTEDRIELEIKNKLIYDQNKRIIDSYRTAEIVVSNHMGSTYLESISLDIPTIIFCDDKITKFRESANDIYLKLINIGILHSDGVSASNFINKLYETNTLNKWWNSPETVMIKKQFIKSYVNISKNWYKEFISKIEYIKGTSI